MKIIKSVTLTRTKDNDEYIVGNNCTAIRITRKTGDMAYIEYYEIELNDGSFIEIIASDVISRYTKEINT